MRHHHLPDHLLRRIGGKERQEYGRVADGTIEPEPPLLARVNLDYFETSWCFVGHSHFQAIFQYHEAEDDISIEVPPVGEPYKLKDRAILNPGSVGQPRDRDPRAAYAIYQPRIHTWETHRVEYDILSVQKRILSAGLPPRHAERLSGGW